jgi:predicted RNA-binding Zn-ribbon protein involved in translation (DUF1610 family)
VREIKYIGIIKKPNCKRGERMSLFECPDCKNQIIRIQKDGLKQETCANCYHKRRQGKRYGASNKRGYVMISGYKYIMAPDHPFATRSGYVAEHRLIAEKTIGRLLKRDEVAHHINFTKTDNRPENIMVLTASEHSRLHSKISPINKRGGSLHAKAN